MSARTEIETTLANFLNTLAPAIPVAWEGVPFNKPTSGIWVQPFMVSNTPVCANIGAQRFRTIGTYQINVFFKDGEGSAKVEAFANQIAALYPVFPKSGTVSFDKPTNAQTPYTDTDFRVVPVRIVWRTEY